MDLNRIIAELRTERQRIEAAIQALSNSHMRRRTKRTMSDEARRRISLAQKRRWAAQKKK